MKIQRQLLVAAVLSLSLVGNSFAGRGHHYDDHRGYRSYHERSHHHHHRPQQHSYGHWIAPAAALAIGGLMVGAAMAAPTVSQPRTVYSAPPPQQPNAWYYCQSSGMYYPHTQACPEGWVAVAPY